VNKIYLSSSFFDNLVYDRDCYSGGSSDQPHRSQYDILAHVEQRLAATPNDFDRVDCISSLKRAIDFRIDSLVSSFCLDKVRQSKGEPYAELLGRLGLVRPLVLSQIRKHRNALVHSETAPYPSQDTTETFLDVAWYFLRSTDWLFSYTFVNYTLARSYRSGEWTDAGLLRMAPESDWQIELHGDVPESMLSADERDGFYTMYTSQPLTALAHEKPDKAEEDFVAIRAVIWDDSARDFFGRLYFDLAADFL
jgi:hypothetical protein